MENMLSFKEAMKVLGITRQAICIAMKGGRLKAYKKGRFTFFKQEDLDLYKANRGNREVNSRYNGNKTWDNEKGEYSINQVAKMLNLKPAAVYTQVRMGIIKVTRKGAHMVVIESELKKFKAFIEKKIEEDKVYYAIN